MWFSTLFWAVAMASLATAMPRHETRGAFSAKGVIEKQWKSTNIKLLATLNFVPFELTNVRLECDADPDRFTPSNYTCGFTFDWSDPNSVKYNNVSSATCKSSWNWWVNTTIGGEDTPMDVPYSSCWQDERTYFAMRLKAFYDPGNFTVQLARSYHDPDNFTAPWDYPTTFAQPTFTLPKEDGNWRSIVHSDPGPIEAVIMGLSN